ncbi:MAG: type I pullulanase [Lachnospiraceae bacterium]|nr:type I pullulanase [Lachnospiraceae bacterium]
MNKEARELKDYYLTKEFEDKYNYEGSLGAKVDERGTVIRLWSPIAESVDLRLYDNGSTGEAEAIIPMKLCDRGVWEYAVNENLSGKYYDFALKIKGKTNISTDPYAKACGVNGKRSMIIDLNTTNPNGWAEDKAPAKGAEDIIYELHVKEFSYDKNAGFPENVRGKYKAFTVDNTTLRNEGKLPTGLNYIKELGVSHIQLLPVYDFASVDEAGDKDSFNWGYDPLNYNVPEGSYASDATRGEVRIKEFKEMIQAIHKKGLRVIMDVVYNHTFSLDNALQNSMPYYHYRLDEKGELSDGSACGNDIASEMPMTEKYIIDSVLYWCEEYHIDGFRFDLMGLLTVDLMNKVQKALDDTYGRGEKLIYGEPWTAAKTHMEKGAKGAVKDNVKLLDENIGIFSDDIRDSIKGHVFYDEVAGFVNGNLKQTDKIEEGLTSFGLSPNHIISYVSCHDNHTLWDKLTITTGDEAERIKQNKLAAAIYMSCQGRVFIYSGEEYLRTKNGEHNTFNMPIGLNKMDWELTEKNKDMVSFYKELIGLRKEMTGICDKSYAARDNITTFVKEEGLLGVKVVNRETSLVKPTYKEALIIFNANKEEKTVALPEGKYKLLINTVKKNNERDDILVSDKIKINGITALFLGKM